jgi:hypothetical protein
MLRQNPAGDIDRYQRTPSHNLHRSASFDWTDVGDKIGKIDHQHRFLSINEFSS